MRGEYLRVFVFGGGWRRGLPKRIKEKQKAEYRNIEEIIITAETLLHPVKGMKISFLNI